MEERKYLQWFLIRNFIIILVVTGLVENLVKAYINQMILPFIQSRYFSQEAVTFRFSGTQLIIISFAIIGEMILRGIKNIIPGFFGSGIQYVVEGLERRIILALPDFYRGQPISPRNFLEAVLLIVIVVFCIALLLLPYILAAMFFARLVSKEFQEINEQERRLHEEFDRKRNLMLSDIAHDLRTPITSVAGFAKALEDGLVTEEDKKKEYLHTIQEKASRVSSLMDLLFEYVKLDSDGFRLDKKPVDILELLRSSAALFYSEMEEKGLELEVQIPEEAVFVVSVDAIQMERVLSNLLTNAIRHNEAGGNLLLAFEEEDGDARIIVADDGKPIPESVRDHLFEPFAVGDESRSSHGGSGLGLSIAAKIVQMHGWSLELKTWKKEYSKAFVIIIPHILMQE